MAQLVEIWDQAEGRYDYSYHNLFYGFPRLNLACYICLWQTALSSTRRADRDFPVAIEF